MDQTNNVFQFLRFEGFLPAIFILVTAWIIVRLTRGPLDRLGVRFTRWRLTIHQAKAISHLVLYLIAIAVAISFVFDLSDQALFALGGTVAVAVGISLKDLAASVIAGVTILIDKPFQVGDRITYGSTYGEVVEIGLRTVRLVTLDDSMVTIPNNKFLNDVVSSGNAGALDMLVHLDFYIGLDQDLQRAKQIVGEALVSNRYAYLKKPWTIVINQIALDNCIALRLRAKVYVLDVRFEKALETDVTERVVEGFRTAGIQPPVVLHKTAETAIPATKGRLAA